MGKFVYDQGSLAAVEAALSNARLIPYRSLRSSPQGVVDLYTWNEMVVGSFIAPLRIFEITLRNALDQQLRQLFGATWYCDAGFEALARRFAPGVVGVSRSKDLFRDIGPLVMKLNHKARVHPRHNSAGYPTTDDIVANLNFGFWTTLLDPVFEPDLWAKGLHRAFSHYQARTGRKLTRRPIAQRVSDINKLRNQISHNEPLIKRKDILQDYQDILDALSWIHPVVDAWVDHHTRVKEILELRDRPRYFF